MEWPGVGGHSDRRRLCLHAVSGSPPTCRLNAIGRGEGKSRREGRKEEASGTRGTTIPARHNFSFSDLPTGGINPIGSQRVVSQKINGCLLMLPRPLWLTTSASLLRFNYFLSKKGIERLSVPINEERSEEEEENSFLLFFPLFLLCLLKMFAKVDGHTRK